MRPVAALLLLAGCATSEYERMSRLEREVRHALAREVPEAAASVWLARTDGREVLVLDADRKLPAASTIKILLLVEGYAQEAEGAFRWEDSVTFLEEDRVGGAGSMQHEKPGSTWTYRQLARRMISESDNVASNLILKRLGMKSVNRRAERLGLEVTRFSRLFMDLDAQREGRENWTTARELGQLARAIFRKEILTPEACEEMIAVLEHTGRRRIAEGVPKGIAVGHKGGTLPGLCHDVGWVAVPGQPYILSIFLDNVYESRRPGEDRGIAAIEAVARAVWRAMGPGDE